MLAHYDFINASMMGYFRRRLTQAPRDVNFALRYVKEHALTKEAQQAVIDALILKEFAANESICAWIRQAQKHVRFQGLPARIGWLGHGERSRLALLVNDLVQRGRIAGPIAFTRDHLDAASAAMPYRETENMRDGSDAIADWPILNALLNGAAGADLIETTHPLGQVNEHYTI